MKQNTKVIYTGLFCIVMAILLMYMVGGFHMSHPEYNGNRELSATELLLDFTEMNSSCKHTMTLAKDDQLNCSWDIRQGTVDLLIVSESGEKLYQGNKLDHADFKLVIPDDGNYTARQRASFISGRSTSNEGSAVT